MELACMWSGSFSRFKPQTERTISFICGLQKGYISLFIDESVLTCDNATVATLMLLHAAFVGINLCLRASVESVALYSNTAQKTLL